MKINAFRRAETGMVSMVFTLASVAKEDEFAFWDRILNKLAPTAV